jgi:hypothetical protein
MLANHLKEQKFGAEWNGSGRETAFVDKWLMGGCRSTNLPYGFI